jgi:hypothetical protein
LLLDVPAVATGLIAVGTILHEASGDTLREGAVAAVTGGVYLLGGPLVHLAHGSPRRALTSFGLRVGAPIVGGVAGAAALTVTGVAISILLGFALGATPRDIDTRKLGTVIGVSAVAGAGLGAGIGFVAAPIVDATRLGKEKVSVRSSPDICGLAPTITVTKADTIVGIRGTL